MTKRKCEDWLAELLGDGEIHLCDDVREAAKKEKFTKRELREARAVLGVNIFHQFDENGQTQNWFWHLEEVSE